MRLDLLHLLVKQLTETSDPSNLEINLQATVEKAQAFADLASALVPLNITSGDSASNSGTLSFALSDATLAYTTNKTNSVDFANKFR